MSTYVKHFLEELRKANAFSSGLLCMGFLLCYSAFLFCAVLELCAGHILDFWAAHLLARDISGCAAGCVGVLCFQSVVWAILLPRKGEA
ncbi:MAG: hypothetical protein LBQ80_00785 [Clostridium sp.]|nr:hypothetical protein [Clostridium sp.]